MRRAKSQAQLQREYRDRLEAQRPGAVACQRPWEVSTALFEKKNAHYCYTQFRSKKHSRDVSVRRIKQADGAMSPFVEAPLHDGASSLQPYRIEAIWNICSSWQHAKHRHSNARKLYPLKKQHIVIISHLDIAGTHENRSMTEQSVANRLRNSPTTEFQWNVPYMIYWDG